MQTGLRVCLAALLGLVAACATIAPVDAHHHMAAPTVPKPSPQDIKFAQFVHDFRATAMEAGITSATYDAAMSGIKRSDRIEELTQTQPEFVKQVWTYLDTAASPRRVSDGQAAMASQSATLAGIEAKYGVPKEILVSIWGNETDFGRELGSFNIFEALATLAYDGPRAEFGRTELLAALKMLQQEKLDPSQMISSWAGAFGQLQMLPSTFLKSAVDGDGDGKRDLWHSAPDALASAAVEVSNDGWLKGHVWGYEVKLPANFAYEMADGDTTKPIADWTKLGVTRTYGSALPANVENGAIYLPAGVRGPAFMTFANFKVILKYNNAASYALAVCYLADLLAGRPAIVASWPRDEEPLSHDERIALQTGLTQLGFNPGKIDGIIGHDGKAALRAYQKARNLPADGFPTMALLAQVLTESKRKGG
ncbi:MAG TPA: lytic murein transglycosylase [Rhizomicrobium sp.]|nr:lytic murein transglycosylase [Rhizomicrobium sp.]